MTDARTWLDRVGAIHNQLIRNDQRAEWQRLTAEHDAMPAAIDALRAVLDLHQPLISVCGECLSNFPCPTVTAITTALEDT